MSVSVIGRGPSRPGADRDPHIVPTLPPVRCQIWCIDQTGHPGAVHVAEQSCVGVEQRIDTVNGGSTGGDQASVTFATLYSRAQKVPGQPVTFLIGVVAGDTETTIELNSAELQMVIEQATTLLRLTSREVDEPRA